MIALGCLVSLAPVPQVMWAPVLVRQYMQLSRLVLSGRDGERDWWSQSDSQLYVSCSALGRNTTAEHVCLRRAERGFTQMRHAFGEGQEHVGIQCRNRQALLFSALDA